MTRWLSRADPANVFKSLPDIPRLFTASRVGLLPVCVVVVYAIGALQR